MAQLMKKVRTAVVYPLVAAMMLNVGCATSSQLRSRRVDVSDAKITFVDQTPQNLDELTKAVENEEEAIKYSGRFDEIKTKIKLDESYNPQQDIRSLHSDIMHSNLGNKEGLAKIMEDFSYYKVGEFVEKPKYGGVAEAAFGLGIFSIFASCMAGTYYVAMDKKDETLSLYPFLWGAAGAITMTLIFSFSTEDLFHKYTSEREVLKGTYFRPYEGIEKQIE